MSKQTPYALHPQRTQMVVAYRNKSYIADLVLPRVDTAELFTYTTYPKETFLTIPDSKPVGRKGAVPEISGVGAEASASTDDYGVDEVVPLADIKRYNDGLISTDPEDAAAIRLAEWLALQRESRVATLMTSASTYASGNSLALSGSNKWSDPSSDPQKAITAQLDKMPWRPNKAVIGQSGATSLLTHPKIVSAFHGNEGSTGRATLQFVAQLVGLDEILIGTAVGNTAALGQPAVISRIWGDAFAMYYQSPITVDTKTFTFGFTAESESRKDADFFDINKGVRGSNVQRVYESVKEVIMAPDLGFVFQTTT